MKLRLFTALSIISILFLTVVGTTFAQTATVGVSKGETFDYTYSFVWSSTNPSATPPSEYVEFNNTQTIQMKITDVSGTQINLQCIKHFKDGTQNVESGYINVDSGAIEVPYGYLIISANLSINQKMYPSGGHQTITGTSLRSYSSGQRETNSYISESTSEKTEINFDKLKGIAVDYSYQTQETSGGYTTTIKEILTNTNSDVWSVIPEFPSAAVLMLLLIAVPIVLVAYKKNWLINRKFAMPLKQ
jgi:hypothetical protein